MLTFFTKGLLLLVVAARRVGGKIASAATLLRKTVIDQTQPHNCVRKAVARFTMFRSLSESANFKANCSSLTEAIKTPTQFSLALLRQRHRTITLTYKSSLQYSTKKSRFI